MKVSDKRKVIEVLLCCGQDPWSQSVTETTGGTAHALEASLAVNVEANRQWQLTRLRSKSFPPHGEVCITAAYLLIESSPTLRREWFGAR